MSSEVNTTTNSDQNETASQNLHNIDRPLMTSHSSELTPLKDEENKYSERDYAQNVMHLSPESEDERVNSGNVSLPLEEHVSYTPVKEIHEECIKEEENYFNGQLINEDDKTKVINNNKEAKLLECSVANEGNEEKDDESDSEDAVLLIGCVKSANEAIELVRKCQRNYYNNNCHLDCVDGNGDDNNNNKYDNNNTSCLETTNHEQRARELETLTGSQCAKASTKRAKNNRPNKVECHDLPITLQEFAEQAQCSVSLFVTRSAVFSDALTGFTNEAQREQKEELRLRELYVEQLQEEQRERVYWEQEEEEEERQLTRQKASLLESNNNRDKVHESQIGENKMEQNDISKGKEADTVKSSEHTSIMASELSHNKAETEEETLQMSSCTAAAQLSAKQQYFLFMKDKLSQNKSTPYFLRHKYPVYERYSISTSGLGTNAHGESSSIDDHNKSYAMERRTNRIVIGNDQVAREWRFVWKQFRRDIAREVFIVQESVLNNADDAAVIVLSYLEYAFDRGSADALVRHSTRMKSINGQESKSSPNNSLSLQNSEPSTTTTTSTMTTPECTSWEETSPFTTTSGNLHASANNASPTRIRNRDVWRSLLSVGGAAVKDALAHAQAALPEFVVEPIRDVITQIKNNNNNNNNNNNDNRDTERFAGSTELANSTSSTNNNNTTQTCGTRSTLSRLREMWQARIEGREIKSIYPRSIKEKGRKVFAAAREVILAGQQSFLAFPYMLLYEQIGMHALACATPLPSRNVTSSDDDEIEQEENDEVDEVENTDNKIQMKENAEKECGHNKPISSEHVEIKTDDKSNELCSKSTESEDSQQAEICNSNANEIADNNNISVSNNNSSKKDSIVLEKLEDDDDDDGDENEWSVLDDLEKLSSAKEVARPKIENVAEIRNAKKKQHQYHDSQNRTHHFKRNEPLMIGEPAVRDLHKFCAHIKKKIQRKDAMNGCVNSNKSLFREDIDGSVFLIPTYSPSELVSPSDKSEIHNTDNVIGEQNAEEQKHEQTQVKPSHKRGTRIHLYYSSSRGVPVVCVSKLFRLYTISQSTETKKEIYEPEEIEHKANEVNENGTEKNNASKNV